MLRQLRTTAGSARARTLETLDTRLPPEKRRELFEKLQAWAQANPKLAAFVAAHLFCSVPPILLFLTYIGTLLLASTFAALTVALVFVGIAAALACLVLVPVLFVTSVSATGFFMAGYIAVRLAQRFKASEDSTTSEKPTEKAHAVEKAEIKVNGIVPNSNSSSGATNGLLDGIVATGRNEKSQTGPGAVAPATQSVSNGISSDNTPVRSPPSTSPDLSQDSETVAEVKQEMAERKNLIASNGCGPEVQQNVAGRHSRPALF